MAGRGDPPPAPSKPRSEWTPGDFRAHRLAQEAATGKRAPRRRAQSAAPGRSASTRSGSQDRGPVVDTPERVALREAQKHRDNLAKSTLPPDHPDRIAAEQALELARQRHRDTQTPEDRWRELQKLLPDRRHALENAREKRLALLRDVDDATDRIAHIEQDVADMEDERAALREALDRIDERQRQERELARVQNAAPQGPAPKTYVRAADGDPAAPPPPTGVEPPPGAGVHPPPPAGSRPSGSDPMVVDGAATIAASGPAAASASTVTFAEAQAQLHADIDAAAAASQTAWRDQWTREEWDLWEAGKWRAPVAATSTRAALERAEEELRRTEEVARRIEQQRAENAQAALRRQEELRRYQEVANRYQGAANPANWQAWRGTAQVTPHGCAPVHTAGSLRATHPPPGSVVGNAPGQWAHFGSPGSGADYWYRVPEPQAAGGQWANAASPEFIPGFAHTPAVPLPEGTVQPDEALAGLRGGTLGPDGLPVDADGEVDY